MNVKCRIHYDRAALQWLVHPPVDTNFAYAFDTWREAIDFVNGAGRTA